MCRANISIFEMFHDFRRYSSLAIAHRSRNRYIVFAQSRMLVITEFYTVSSSLTFPNVMMKKERLDILN